MRKKSHRRCENIEHRSYKGLAHTDLKLYLFVRNVIFTYYY